MPRPLPDDRDFLRRVYDDASSVVTWLQRFTRKYEDILRQYPDGVPDDAAQELRSLLAGLPGDAIGRLGPFYDQPVDIRAYVRRFLAPADGDYIKPFDDD